MPASQNVVLPKGYNAGAAITKKRFVHFTADETVSQVTNVADVPCGVSLFSVTLSQIAQGKGASVLVDGRAIVEAGEAINLGDPVSFDNQGRATVAASGDRVVGACDEKGATAAGQEVSVHLDLPGSILA